LIQFPDFTGNTVDEAQEILASEYPGLQCHIIPYQPPRAKGSFSGSKVVCRIIRQREIDGRLEFTVSSFRYNE
jgi:hypothetical protein